MQENVFIGSEEWQKRILEIREKIVEDLTDHEAAKSELKKALVSAIEERLPNEPFAILFSGGIDSSLITLIAKKAGKQFTCYNVGFQENETKIPEDFVVAEKAAKELGIKLKTKLYTLEEMNELFKRTVKVLGKELNNVVNVGVGSVEQACIEIAKKDGMKIFLGGLGSEELFAGYERHKKAENKQEECWNGLKVMHVRDLQRDAAIVAENNIVFATPFLDKTLIETAMRIPEKYKIDNKFTKIILREIAEELGMPDFIAWRKKKAAQYGSRMNHALTKISAKKGFEYKKDYLKSLE